jgi:hypothetical protein
MNAVEPRYHVEHLRPAGEVAVATLGNVFRAPWRAVSVVRLRPGEEFGGRDLGDSEALVFVTAGRGTAELRHGTVELRDGTSLTLFKDERLELRAGDEALEFFFAEMGSR